MGRPPLNDIKPNQVFGRLTALERLNGSTWSCKCTCGNVVPKLSTALRNGLVRSCGCLLREAKGSPPASVPITAHGVTKTTMEWASQTGIPSRILRQRINLGWAPERAVDTPVRPRAKCVAH